MDKIKVLIVDDHAVLRDGIRALLGLYEDVEIVGEASEGKEAVEKAQELNPNVVVMDSAMPRMGGLEATPPIIRCNPKVKVVILTDHDTRECVAAAVGAGASGYVPKHAYGLDLASAIRSVHRGSSFLYSTAASALIVDYLRQAEKGPSDNLTTREREILRLVGEGQGSRRGYQELNPVLDPGPPGVLHGFFYHVR